MNSPQETLELQGKQTKQVAVTTMGFRPGDVNNFVVGSEEGPIYMATRHGKYAYYMLIFSFFVYNVF